jgi:hypothetical protein
MASNFKPPAAFPKFVRGFDDVKKILVSANGPRLMRSGALLWLNKVANRYQAESGLLSATNAATDSTSANSSASTYGSIALANAQFAPLFLGMAATARVPQQLFTPGAYSAQGSQTYSPGDASSPFLSFYDEGIALIPVGPNLSSTGVLTATVEPGSYVQLDGFVNEAATGFYDPAGALQKDTYYYLYDNCCNTTATAANAFGVVVERGNIGDSMLVVKFKSYVLNPSLG